MPGVTQAVETENLVASLITELRELLNYVVIIEHAPIRNANNAIVQEIIKTLSALKTSSEQIDQTSDHKLLSEIIEHCEILKTALRTPLPNITAWTGKSPTETAKETLKLISKYLSSLSLMGMQKINQRLSAPEASKLFDTVAQKYVAAAQPPETTEKYPFNAHFNAAYVMWAKAKTLSSFDSYTDAVNKFIEVTKLPDLKEEDRKLAIDCAESVLIESHDNITTIEDQARYYATAAQLFELRGEKAQSRAADITAKLLNLLAVLKKGLNSIHNALNKNLPKASQEKTSTDDNDPNPNRPSVSQTT